jgi:transposase-like protein
MQRRRFSREFKLEAVKLAGKRGVSSARGSLSIARLVVLHRQDVISAALHDSFRHPTMTMRRIRRDDAALQLKKLDEMQGASRFVVSRRQHIGKRHAGHCAPRRYHRWRHVTLAAFVGSSQSLAVESYRAFGGSVSRAPVPESCATALLSPSQTAQCRNKSWCRTAWPAAQ